VKINPHSGRAVYRQVADDLRDRIESGDLQPGDELLSEAELEDEYGVGAGTIRRALSILVREGLIVTERGQRHRVADYEIEVVEVQPGSRVVARVARPADSRRHRIPEGEYIVLITTPDGEEHVYVAARTELVVPEDAG
jgi:DNA-binding GntR family transcriptional regulator